MMGKGEGVIAGLFGAVILICMGLVMGGSLLFLRKLILDFNRVAAIIAAILSGIAVGLGSLSVLGAVIGIVMGRGLPGLISLAIAALGLAAFAQLLMFLIQVIKEPE